MSDRFSGSISISRSGRDPYKTELDAAMQQYQEYGFKLPASITDTAFLFGVGGAFIQSELPPVEYIPDINQATQQFFGREVRPELARAAEKGEPKALRLAFQMGRLLSAANVKGRSNLESPLPFRLEENTLTADGYTQPYDLQTGWIVDYGMGMVGLFTHLKNIKDGRYSVLGLQKTKGERTALQGIAAHRQVNPNDLQIFDGGITVNAEALLKSSGQHIVDMVIASRVHEAGKDLASGISLASQMLRAGGLLVARGPRRYSQGIDYDQIQAQIQRQRGFRIVHNHQFDKRTPRGGVESNRTLIAQAA